jgi:hypothetical protein
VPGEFNACVEWRRIATDRMRRDIQRRRRHFFNKRVSLVNYVSPDTKPEEMLVDESAGAARPASKASGRLAAAVLCAFRGETRAKRSWREEAVYRTREVAVADEDLVVHG